MSNHVPNQIPLDKRVRNLLLSVALLAYGGYGIYMNDLWIPGRRGMHLTDESALIMFAAFVCGSLVMLSVVVDHYDKRNNEQKYKAFADFFSLTGLGLFVAALTFFLVRKLGSL